MTTSKTFKALAAHNLPVSDDQVTLNEGQCVSSVTVYTPAHFMSVHMNLRPKFAEHTKGGESVLYVRTDLRSNLDGGKPGRFDALFLAPLSELPALQAAAYKMA